MKLFTQAGTSRLFFPAPRNRGLVLPPSFLPNHPTKNWRIGKAFHIKDIIHGNYFYPKEDGTGDVSPTPRPLKEGELVSYPQLSLTAVALSHSTG